MQARFWFLLVLCGLTWWPSPGHAWWDAKWSNRKAIAVDASAKGANTAVEVADVPVLVRLHTGNFSDFFALKEGAADLRFLAEDDKTL
ncbi:MAG TPA: DUF2341 domain-containing protein, partial [Burkholderiales bacterium]|nr:DUF2341 domain-containing protein [Burkholderiales bacterium]